MTPTAERGPDDQPRSDRALVAVMEPADLRDGDDPATWRGFDDSWLGTVVVKRLVWPHGVVVVEVRPQETTQMSLIENEEMVEALSSNRADDPLCEGILPGRAGGR